MSEAKPEVKAATVQELSALAGADSNFVVEQLNAGATLAQATNALNAKLTAEIAEARKQTAELIEKANNQQETDDEGVEPIGSASHSPSNGGTVGNHKPSGTANSVWGEDPVAFHNEKLDELIASGMSTAQASSQLNRKYPGLLNAMRDSVFKPHRRKDRADSARACSMHIGTRRARLFSSHIKSTEGLRINDNYPAIRFAGYHACSSGDNRCFHPREDRQQRQGCSCCSNRCRCWYYKRKRCSEWQALPCSFARSAAKYDGIRCDRYRIKAICNRFRQSRRRRSWLGSCRWCRS